MTAAAKSAATRNYFYRLDDMDLKALVPSMTSAEGALVQGDKLYVGLVRKAKGSGSQPHTHPFEQFNYVLKGALKACVDGQQQLVTVGGLIHIPANTVHTTVAGTDEDCLYLMLKEVTPMGIAGVVQDPSATGPLYEEGYAPSANVK
jgi:quercetin dioxygenase-like cupin family protein